MKRCIIVLNLVRASHLGTSSNDQASGAISEGVGIRMNADHAPRRGAILFMSVGLTNQSVKTPTMRNRIIDWSIRLLVDGHDYGGRQTDTLASLRT